MICGRREGVLSCAAYHKTWTLHIIFELFSYDQVLDDKAYHCSSTWCATWRAAARHVQTKTKIVDHTWIFIHQYVLYYKWRHCSTPRRAAMRRISQKQNVLDHISIYHSQVCARWKRALLLYAQAQGCAPRFLHLENRSCRSYSHTFCLVDTSHSALFASCIFILSDASMICGRREGVSPRATYHKNQTLQIIFELFIYDQVLDARRATARQLTPRWFTPRWWYGSWIPKLGALIIIASVSLTHNLFLFACLHESVSCVYVFFSICLTTSVLCAASLVFFCIFITPFLISKHTSIWLSSYTQHCWYDCICSIKS